MKQFYFLLVSLLFVAHYTTAQENTEALQTPYDAIYQHLYYLQSDSYEPAKSAIVIQNLKQKKAIDKAIKIKQVLDSKNLYVVMSALPKDSVYQDSTGRSRYILFPEKQPEIYLERVGHKWMYSAETVELIGQLHADLYPWGSAKLLEILPKVGTGRFLGLMVWQYVGLAIFVLLALVLYYVLTQLLDRVLKWLANKNIGGWQDDTGLIHKIAKFLGLILITVLLRLFLPVLQLPIQFNSGASLVLDILRYVFWIYLALRVFDVIMIFLRKATSRTETNMDDQLLKILRSAVRLAIVVFGIITILNRLDVNVAALVAGVSIGGLAIALAAQDSVKNLIGAFMIFFDKPFDVGDYIIAGEVQGVVKEVGFRSTRIQSADTSIISVPNGKIADQVVNNMGRRVYRRYKTTLSIKYDTAPETIELFIDGLEELLLMHPSIADDKTQVRLNEFSASSLDIMLLTYFKLDSWDAELTGKQNVMLGILRLAKTLGVEFAYPSQSVYIEQTKPQEHSGDKATQMKQFLNDYKNELNQELLS